MKHKHKFNNSQTIIGLAGELTYFDKVCKCGLAPKTTKREGKVK